MPNVIDSIFPELRPLIRKRKLKVKTEVYDERSFGNAYVDLIASGFDVRAVKDRGEMSLQVALPGLEWAYVAFLLNRRETAEFGAVVTLLDEHFELILPILKSRGPVETRYV